MLIDQFCEATRQWSYRTGSTDYDIVWYVMTHTGGADVYKRVGRHRSSHSATGT